MRIVPLAEWGGTPNGWPRMTLPAEGVVVHHSVTTPTGDAFTDFRVLDAIGRGRGHGGVSYSFVVHPSGVVGEGQGTRRGAHTGGNGCGGSPWGWNPCSFGVCLVGNFERDVPAREMVDAFRWLRAQLVAEGVLRADGFVRAHGDMPGNATACPGRNVRDRLGEFEVPWEEPRSRSRRMEMLVIPGPRDGVRRALFVQGHVIVHEVEGRVNEFGVPVDASNHRQLIDPQMPIQFLVQPFDVPIIERLRQASERALGGGGGGVSPAEVRAAVRAELDRTRLAS